MLLAASAPGCVLSMQGSGSTQTHYILGFGRVEVDLRDPITATEVRAIGLVSNSIPHPSIGLGYIHKTSIVFDQDVVGDITVSNGVTKLRTAKLPDTRGCQKEDE